jgi:hypothetical protein
MRFPEGLSRLTRLEDIFATGTNGTTSMGEVKSRQDTLATLKVMYDEINAPTSPITAKHTKSLNKEIAALTSRVLGSKFPKRRYVCLRTKVMNSMDSEVTARIRSAHLDTEPAEDGSGQVDWLPSDCISFRDFAGSLCADS